MSNLKLNYVPGPYDAIPSQASPKLDDPLMGFLKNVEMDTLRFSSIDSNLARPLVLSQPTRLDVNQHGVRQERHDSKASHHSQTCRSSTQFIFRTLPPIRRMPSLQVPSLTDLSTPDHLHNAGHKLTTQRSLHKISEKEPSSYQLPITLVHPNSPYVPWEAPVRQRILCTITVASQRDDAIPDFNSAGKMKQQTNVGLFPAKNSTLFMGIWNSMKSAPKALKERCQRILTGRSKQHINECTASGEQVSDSNAGEEQVPSSYPSDIYYSPTASLRSADTNTLAVWLSECHRKFTDKDCESLRLLTIDEYDRVGSWIKTGDFPFPSRMSCSIADGETISSVQIFETEGDHIDFAASSSDHSPCLSTTSSPLRSHFPTKRVGDAEKLSRLVHRASMRSYLVERPISLPNATWST